MRSQAAESGATTIFIVQGFVEARSGSFEIEAPRQARSQEAAIELAKILALTRLGVIVFSRAMDYAMGEYGEPAVLAAYGDIPVDVTNLWEG